MSISRLKTRSDTQIIDQDWFNNIRLAFINEIVPRISTGYATDKAGSLGSSSYRWLKAFIRRGYFTCGSIKMHHSYNGAVGAGEGWMLCDGRVINSTNYDTEHGSGHWNTYVGSSPLNGKYLPNLATTGYFLEGVSATAQDGSIAFTGVGGGIGGNFQTFSHNHQIKKYVAGGQEKTYDSSGNEISIPSGATKSIGSVSLISAAGSGGVGGPYPASWYNDLQLGILSLTPEVIRVQMYMRVIT